MNINDISLELKEKAKQCESAEELVALAESEGVDLSDEELIAIAAGKHNDVRGCPEHQAF